MAFRRWTAVDDWGFGQRPAPPPEPRATWKEAAALRQWGPPLRGHPQLRTLTSLKKV